MEPPMSKPDQRFVFLGMIITFASVMAFAGKDPDIAKVQRVELVDGKGDIRAALAADSNGVVLSLVDKKGHVTASLRLNDDPRLTVRDAAGREAAALGAPRV